MSSAPTRIIWTMPFKTIIGLTKVKIKFQCPRFRTRSISKLRWHSTRWTSMTKIVAVSSQYLWTMSPNSIVKRVRWFHSRPALSRVAEQSALCMQIFLRTKSRLPQLWTCHANLASLSGSSIRIITIIWKDRPSMPFITWKLRRSRERRLDISHSSSSSSAQIRWRYGGLISCPSSCWRTHTAWIQIEERL